MRHRARDLTTRLSCALSVGAVYVATAVPLSAQASPPVAPPVARPPAINRVNEVLPSWLRVRGEFRERMEGFDGLGFNATREDLYYLSRLRLNATVTPARLRSFQVQAQDARVGRQELAYGEQRLVGHVSWLNAARTFDAARVSVRGKKLQVDVFGASVGRLPGHLEYNTDTAVQTGSLGIELTPWKGLPIAANYHSWWLNEKRDGLYNAGGTLLARVIGGAASAHVGQELDVQASRAVTPGASYSHPYVMATYVFLAER